MTKHLFILIFIPLFFLACPDQNNRIEPQPFDKTACNIDTSNPPVTIDEPSEINNSNASDYSISGNCDRNGTEIELYIEGHPTYSNPLCNQGRWEISIDVSGIVRRRQRIQIAIANSRIRGRLCANTTNYFVCPNNYIAVPQLEDFGSRDFCVMKYEAKVSSSEDLPTLLKPKLTKALSLERGHLITRANEENAIKYCNENGPGYTLINNDEWQTIARHIEMTDVNWSNGTTNIKNGNRLNIGNTSSIKSSSNDASINDDIWKLNKRSHKLINGEYIWDFSGNLAELVQHDIVSLPKYSGYIYKIPEALKEVFGPSRDYSILDDRERINGFAGLGWVQANRFNGGLLRGGLNSRTAGIFSADTSRATNNVIGSNTGFRCVYHP